MKLLKSIALILLVLLLSLGSYADIGDIYLTEPLKNAYRVLINLNSPYSEKQKAADYLYEVYIKNSDPTIVQLVVDLLTYTYDQDDFREDDNFKYHNDIIARRLIEILTLARDPLGFQVLVTYVIKANHTRDTIMEAWNAIKAIDWDEMPE